MSIELPATKKNARNRTIAARASARPVIESLEGRQLFAAGLMGMYFSDAALTNQVLTRNDPKIQFTWGKGSPDPSLSSDAFSVRWTGTVTAPSSGTYTFRERASDGIRVWVGGNLLIDDWNQHTTAVSHAAKMALTGGQSYDLKIEYFHNLGPATVSLSWGSGK